MTASTSIPSKFVWMDGRFVPRDRATIPVTTHALHYGTTAFEGIRAYWNSKNLFVFRLDDHIRRLRRSGQFYEMVLGYSNQQIKEAITGLCRKNGLRKSSYIRPFHFVGEHGINMHVTKRAPTHLAIYAFALGSLFDTGGISVGITSWRRFSDSSTPTQAKMAGNYLNSIIATQEARRNGYDEALLLDQNGNISEAPGENIFVVKDGELATPTTSSSVLEGLTCDTVARLARDAGIKAVRRQISRSEIHTADEVFLTGTAAEIIPVLSVDQKRVGGKAGRGGKAGPITKRMIGEYRDVVTNKNGRYSHWLTEVYR